MTLDKGKFVAYIQHSDTDITDDANQRIGLTRADAEDTSSAVFFLSKNANFALLGDRGEDLDAADFAGGNSVMYIGRATTVPDGYASEGVVIYCDPDSDDLFYVKPDGTVRTMFEAGTGGETPVGAATGDLTGSYPAPVVKNIRGHEVASEVLTGTQDGYALCWSQADGYFATRLVILGNDARLTNSRAPSGSATGDLSGSYPSPAVAKINGNAVSTQTLDGTTDGYLLTYVHSDGYYKAKPPTTTIASGSLSSPTITGTVTYSGTNGTIRSIVGEVVTNSTGATTVASFTMSDETNCSFDAIISYSRRTSVTKSATYKRAVTYRRTGTGNCTIVGTIETGTDQETTAGDDVTIDTDGTTTVRVRVTAADSDSRNWFCELRVQEVRNT